MFEIDAIVIRKVYTWIQVRLVYEISKQFVTLYVLAQLWGIGFFLIDNNLLNEPVCVNNPSSKCMFMQCVGSILQLLGVPSVVYPGTFNISTLFTGESIPCVRSVTEI